MILSADIDSNVENWQMDIFPNLHYINDKSVVIGNTELLFSTMWTHLEPVDIYTAERVMTDFNRIAVSNGIFRASSQNRIHGHIHSNCTNGLKTGATTILTNPLGYVDDNENERFDGGAIIEI